jgi:TolA-binding protein
MAVAARQKKSWVKKILITVLVLVLVGAAAIWYIFTEKFSDISESKPVFTVSAMKLISEFQQSDAAANSKYREQVITVNGKVAELEQADTTINVKMTDTLTGSYIIFAFQQQHLKEAKQLKTGDSVSIKGSCSGGVYSSILETEYITFKRCAINK